MLHLYTACTGIEQRMGVRNGSSSEADHSTHQSASTKRAGRREHGVAFCEHGMAQAKELTTSFFQL